MSRTKQRMVAWSAREHPVCVCEWCVDEAGCRLGARSRDFGEPLAVHVSGLEDAG